ncbi:MULTISPECIES: Crp/Fnr family transcriptional regulator [unclassified Mycobacterium]|uniref:Crp/Fnr family transcriptional regulator n=1 Tax=unclassified Mycobacterium TaxID=2642494 RepID=UPI0029C87AC4|nr:MULTISPECIES: Crp/Fnr family transcriptional regulator [unclassified Mycobacterium]
MQAVLAQSGMLQGVEPDAAATLVSRLEPVEFPSKHVIFAQGQPGDRLFIITSGQVKIGHRTTDGRENILALLGPSDMFGELSTFDPGPRTSTATTITAVHALSMDRPALRVWFRESPGVSQHLLQDLARRLRRTDDYLSDLVFIDVPGRVAKQLLRMSERFGVHDGDELRVAHGLTQGELAQLVGTTRETVNKALADFALRGWIRVGVRVIWIRKPRRLAQRAR